MNARPATAGELRRSAWGQAARLDRTVKDEIRANLLLRLREKRPLFPGIHGYADTVEPQIVNALLARHNFILLGLRGQAKSRILRALVALLDTEIPVVPGCPIHDHPLRPLCAACRHLLAEQGDSLAIGWLPAEQRFVEKLATPDVTIADILGDLDPIKAARAGHDLLDERTIHFGLLPRANRGIFAINELPDLAGKIQVGLFNIMQEGDVQIKGYPVRLPLDVLLVFTANPEDYTARGKIVTPLKDRIGSEIRTHYPATIEEGLAITAQEAWTQRGENAVCIPAYVREIIEQIAFLAREDKRVDRRSGVSQRLPITCLENALSNAERRAVRSGDSPVLVRVCDVYAATPSLTGKLELEYQGEIRGAGQIAGELIRGAIGRLFTRYFADADFQPLIQWLERGGELKVDDSLTAAQLLEQLRGIQGLLPHADLAVPRDARTAAQRAAAAEFILEGLWAHRRIGRSEERGFFAEQQKAQRPGPGEPPGGGRPRRQFN
jgi:magnesium chelatase subunit I